jgi:hypothetical protein
LYVHLLLSSGSSDVVLVVCVEQFSGDDSGDALGNEDTGVLGVDRVLGTSLAVVMAAGCATSSLEDNSIPAELTEEDPDSFAVNAHLRPR